jgi:hypothetical protein
MMAEARRADKNVVRNFKSSDKSFCPRHRQGTANHVARELESLLGGRSFSSDIEPALSILPLSEGL